MIAQTGVFCKIGKKIPAAAFPKEHAAGRGCFWNTNNDVKNLRPKVRQLPAAWEEGASAKN